MFGVWKCLKHISPIFPKLFWCLIINNSKVKTREFLNLILARVFVFTKSASMIFTISFYRFFSLLPIKISIKHYVFYLPAGRSV